MPKVSIIVPIYNVERFLDICIQSLINQTLKDIEIILVDDESPDRCPEMCEEYAHNDNRIKVIHKKNGGLGFARNSGLEIATGDYVAFVDSDDYVEVTAYEYLYHQAQRYNLDILRFQMNRFCSEGKFDKVVTTGDICVYDGRERLRHIALCGFSQLNEEDRRLRVGRTAWGALYNRAFLLNNHLLFHSEREFISEDTLFNYQALQFARNIGVVPHTFYHYRYNWASLSRTVALNKIQRSEKYCRYVESLVLKDGYESEDLVYVMGYHVEAMRAESQRVFDSSLSFFEKRKWFLQEMKSDYVARVCHYYPYKTLPIKHRICFICCRERFFYLLYLLFRILYYVRKMNPNRSLENFAINV